MINSLWVGSSRCLSAVFSMCCTRACVRSFAWHPESKACSMHSIFFSMYGVLASSLWATRGSAFYLCAPTVCAAPALLRCGMCNGVRCVWAHQMFGNAMGCSGVPFDWRPLASAFLSRCIECVDAWCRARAESSCAKRQIDADGKNVQGIQEEGVSEALPTEIALEKGRVKAALHQLAACVAYTKVGRGTASGATAATRHSNRVCPRKEKTSLIDPLRHVLAQATTDHR